jgi:hypothetical protein
MISKIQNNSHILIREITFYTSVCQPGFRITSHGFSLEIVEKACIKFLKYCEKFQISLQISQGFLWYSWYY